MISFRYLSIFRTTFSLKCVFPCACGISLGNHLQSQNCFSSVLLSWPISHESLEISGPLTCRIHILAKTQHNVGQHEREPGWPGADPRFRGKEASRFTSAFLARRGCCYHTTVAKRSWGGYQNKHWRLSAQGPASHVWESLLVLKTKPRASLKDSGPFLSHYPPSCRQCRRITKSHINLDP